jgi:hypothetical protein
MPVWGTVAPAVLVGASCGRRRMRAASEATGAPCSSQPVMKRSLAHAVASLSGNGCGVAIQLLPTVATIDGPEALVRLRG